MNEYVGCTVHRENDGRLRMQQPHLLKKIEKEFKEELGVHVDDNALGREKK